MLPHTTRGYLRLVRIVLVVLVLLGVIGPIVYAVYSDLTRRPRPGPFVEYGTWVTIENKVAFNARVSVSGRKTRYSTTPVVYQITLGIRSSFRGDIEFGKQFAYREFVKGSAPHHIAFPSMDGEPEHEAQFSAESELTKELWEETTEQYHWSEEAVFGPHGAPVPVLSWDADGSEIVCSIPELRGRPIGSSRWHARGIRDLAFVVARRVAIYALIPILLIWLATLYRFWRWMDRLKCPSCGYSLRGFSWDTGCPECGWKRANKESK